MSAIMDTLNKTGLPVAYGFFRDHQEPPYIAYIGGGQDQFKADNTVYNKTNVYQVEYYFKNKNEAAEEAIEQTLTDDGFIYEKSEDVYMDDDDLWLIYYDTWRK